VSLLALALAACAPAPRPAAPAALDPPDSVEIVLTRWYDAMAAHDSAGGLAPLPPEFLLVEDTTLVTREQLVRGLMAGAGHGHQTSERSGFHTVVTDSVAWTTLRNHEQWLPTKGTPLTLDFIETVVFRKHEGRWMIDRYHATRLR
jgi:hypothetical protein